MGQTFALVTAQEGFLYAALKEGTGTPMPEFADVMLSGWSLAVLEERGDWAFVRTFYGYEGWIRKRDIRLLSREELKQRQDRERFMRIGARSTDLRCEPRVQGGALETLLQDSLVEVLRQEKTDAAGAAPADTAEACEKGREGWSLVRSAAGVTGWVFSASLAKRNDNDGYLLEPDPAWFTRQAQRVIADADEEQLREAAVQSARSYLGCAYRWGGKSPLGIDCSGLVFMSWMEQGILVYRDALIKDGFPIRQIDRADVKKGDLLFFPGHVAMSLGGDRFIHATGAEASPYVRINSLHAQDEDYREDLAGNVTMCGTVF